MGSVKLESTIIMRDKIREYIEDNEFFTLPNIISFLLQNNIEFKEDNIRKFLRELIKDSKIIVCGHSDNGTSQKNKILNYMRY